MTAFVAEILLQEKIAVIATDTLYGIVGRALSKTVVERIYEVKGRDEGKPFIILIPDSEALKDFGIVLSVVDKQKVESLWPGPVTVILPLPQEASERFTYLHRGSNTLAFRMPNKNDLIDILKKTGPLVAPSANPQGKMPATTIDEAREYFGNMVDYYQDAGTVHSLPSTIIALEKGEVVVIRQGVVRIV